VPAEVETPLTVSIHRESLQASQPTDSQVNSIHNIPTALISSSFAYYQRGSAENSPHLGAAMHLLNTKSEEISKLENQLSAERRTNEDLLQQLSALRQHITESTNNTPSAIMTLEQELADARAQLALQTVSWENERATLTLNSETAIRGKVSAEQDRDFFREQYAKASDFVSSVRDENAELEKQIKIATDQAHSGVDLIKTTFELRTKSLEEDVRAWRRIAEFLIDKDHRTNDDIRRRAAEEPELRARCNRQESALEDFSKRLLQSEVDLDVKERQIVEAEDAREAWQETTVKLKLDLNEAKTKLERIGKVGFGAERLKCPPPTPEPPAPEFTYRCRWKSDDSNGECEAVFFNILVCSNFGCFFQ
jgi:chromosome segregation ATPase